MKKLLLFFCLATAVHAQQSAGYIKFSGLASPPPTPLTGVSVYADQSQNFCYIDQNGVLGQFIKASEST